MYTATSRIDPLNIPIGKRFHCKLFPPAPLIMSLSKKAKSVLTNLQRGNTEADVPIDRILNFHEQAGQGEITLDQARSQGLIDRVDKYGYTALHYACYYGQLTSVKILVECGADVNKSAPEMSSPLLLASSGGHAEIVKFILGCGADVHHMDIVRTGKGC